LYLRIDIKNAFEKHNIEIKGLAEKMGISRQSLHYFINRGNENSFETLLRLSDASGISIEDFFVVKCNFICPNCGKELHVKIT
jgi:plasmid maintenance system antidote protein VapI